jgi:hypothetical protein
MSIMSIARSAACFLRPGSRYGLPAPGYSPLLALLPRRLSDDEVTTVALTARRSAFARGASVDRIAIGVAITKITGALPSDSDMSRVTRRLADAGR